MVDWDRPVGQTRIVCIETDSFYVKQTYFGIKLMQILIRMLILEGTHPYPSWSESLVIPQEKL